MAVDRALLSVRERKCRKHYGTDRRVGTEKRESVQDEREGRSKKP